MASELLKNKIFIQRLKEPDVPNVKFNLADTGFEELITLPEPKPQKLLDIQGAQTIPFQIAQLYCKHVVQL